MSGLLTTLAEQAATYSLIEVIAVLLATAYLLLAIRENIWCWLCAGISTAIYVYLFINAKLYMESALNAYYFVMAIYGWSLWSSRRADSERMPVVVWRVKWHAVAIAVILMISAVSGYLMQHFTDAVYPYVDSLTTWGAIWATFLVARKVLENWWYWLAVDLVSIFLFWSNHLELTAMLFAAYVIMIPFGLISWTQSWRAQSA